MQSITDQAVQCPVRQHLPMDEIAVQQLREMTVHSSWKTPSELGRAYGYTPKHIIRLVTNPNNRIAAVNVDRRWFILHCTFARHINPALDT